MNRNNRGRVIADSRGDWQQYSPRLSATDKPLGTVTVGGLTGALVEVGQGEYFLVVAENWTPLNARKVAATLAAAAILWCGHVKIGDRKVAATLAGTEII